MCHPRCIHRRRGIQGGKHRNSPSAIRTARECCTTGQRHNPWTCISRQALQSNQDTRAQKQTQSITLSFEAPLAKDCLSRRPKVVEPMSLSYFAPASASPSAGERQFAVISELFRRHTIAVKGSSRVAAFSREP